MYDFIFSRIMDSDIDLNYKYIIEKFESPMAAQNLYNELYEKINDILENTYKRPLVQDKYLASLGIRSIKIKNYILFYSITEEKNTVNILRFMHSLRDWINILKDENIEEMM